jgi:hypothetical protein
LILTIAIITKPAVDAMQQIEKLLEGGMAPPAVVLGRAVLQPPLPNYNVNPIPHLAVPPPQPNAVANLIGGFMNVFPFNYFQPPPVIAPAFAAVRPAAQILNVPQQPIQHQLQQQRQLQNQLQQQIWRQQMRQRAAAYINPPPVIAPPPPMIPRKSKRNRK